MSEFVYEYQKTQPENNGNNLKKKRYHYNTPLISLKQKNNNTRFYVDKSCKKKYY